MTAAPLEAELATIATPPLRDILPRWVPFRIVARASPSAADLEARDQAPSLAEILPAWSSARRVERSIEPPPVRSSPDLEAAPQVELAIAAVEQAIEVEELEEAVALAHPAASADVSPLARVGLESPPASEREYSPLALVGIAAPNPSDLEHAPLHLAGIVPPEPADLARARYFTAPTPPPPAPRPTPGDAEPPFPGSFADLLRRIAEAETRGSRPGSSS